MCVSAICFLFRLSKEPLPRQVAFRTTHIFFRVWFLVHCWFESSEIVTFSHSGDNKRSVDRRYCECRNSTRQRWLFCSVLVGSSRWSYWFCIGKVLQHETQVLLRILPLMFWLVATRNWVKVSTVVSSETFRDFFSLSKIVVFLWIHYFVVHMRFSSRNIVVKLFYRVFQQPRYFLSVWQCLKSVSKTSNHEIFRTAALFFVRYHGAL
jgi:hypothetical protein